MRAEADPGGWADESTLTCLGAAFIHQTVRAGAHRLSVRRRARLDLTANLNGYRRSKIATLFNVWPLASLPVVATIIVFRSSEMTRW